MTENKGRKNTSASCESGEPDAEEKQQIELHKYFLSIRAGGDVGWDAAYRDWMENYSRKWKHYKMMKDSEDEIQEMLKHKWIESEKAGCDLGQQALFDWINKYAGRWRVDRKKRRR